MEAGLLKNMGMTKSEIKVYMRLLERNPASATEIAEKANIYRRNAYDALNKLIKRGLASYADEGRRRMFYAANPQKLIEIIELRKKEMQSLLPELKALYKPSASAEGVEVFKGTEGLKTIFEDILNSKRDYNKIGCGEKFRDMLPYYYLQYQKKKKESNIKCKAIHSKTERDERFVKEFIGEVRFLRDEFVGSSTTIIYGKKVAVIVWKENPTGILINSEEVARSYDHYFRILWASSRK